MKIADFCGTIKIHSLKHMTLNKLYKVMFSIIGFNDLSDDLGVENLPVLYYGDVVVYVS